MITVTKVKVTSDLKLAKIYISFLENKKNITDIIGIIIAKKNQIRNFIGKHLEIKYIPELRFFYDNSIDQADKINKILKKINIHD